MGEISVADMILHFVEDLLQRQIDQHEIGFKACKIRRLQGGQEPIGAMIGVEGLGHGDCDTSPGQRREGRIVSAPVPNTS